MSSASVSIYYGHNACVAVEVKSKLKAVYMEERFAKLKNAVGFPEMALAQARTCLEQHDIKWNDVTFVIPDQSLDGLDWLYKNGWQVKPYVFVPGAGKFKSFYSTSTYKLKKILSNILKTRDKTNLKKLLAKKIDAEISNIQFVDHHLSHISCANEFYGQPKGIGFVVDAIGDRKSFSVWSSKNEDWYEEVSGGATASLGYFYSAVTELLGLKPNEHEFKVMGMAPYGDERYAVKTIKEIKQYINIKNGIPKLKESDYLILLNALSKSLMFHRFDLVSYSAQKILEEVFCACVEYWCNKLNQSVVTLSGGVMMNVKLIKKVSELDCVKELRVVPSSGDESLAIGALHAVNNIKYNYRKNLYLGLVPGRVSDLLIDSSIKVEKYEPEKVAKLLSEDNIGALCWGREEWGARALGHRSIICRPDRFKNIERINSAVKKRDFWMPFTPSIIDQYWDKYIKKNCVINPYYMASTFDSTNLGRQHLEAAVHPRDFTVRGQRVEFDISPKYYELIKAFSEMSGIGALLNTSFNMHGKPNVQTANDAFETFKECALDFLVVEDLLYIKR